MGRRHLELENRPKGTVALIAFAALAADKGAGG
jgi:hypothetical protein